MLSERSSRGPARPHAAPTRRPVFVCSQGRLRVDSWQDKTTGAKRTAYKVVASSISRVRRTGVGMPASAAPAAEEPAAGFGAGGYGEPAPWDAPQPMQQQVAPLEQQQMGAQPAAGQAAPAGQGPFTEESLWMDYFTDPTREPAWRIAALPCVGVQGRLCGLPRLHGNASSLASLPPPCVPLAVSGINGLDRPCPRPTHWAGLCISFLVCLWSAARLAVHPPITRPQSGTTTAAARPTPTPQTSRRRSAGATVSRRSRRAGWLGWATL